MGIPKCSIAGPMKQWFIIPLSRTDTSTSAKLKIDHNFCPAAHFKQTMSKEFTSINIVDKLKRYKWGREWYFLGKKYNLKEYLVDSFIL